MKKVFNDFIKIFCVFIMLIALLSFFIDSTPDYVENFENSKKKYEQAQIQLLEYKLSNAEKCIIKMKKEFEEELLAQEQEKAVESKKSEEEAVDEAQKAADADPLAAAAENL